METKATRIVEFFFTPSLPALVKCVRTFPCMYFTWLSSIPGAAHILQIIQSTTSTQHKFVELNPGKAETKKKKKSHNTITCSCPHLTIIASHVFRNAQALCREVHQAKETNNGSQLFDVEQHPREWMEFSSVF